MLFTLDIVTERARVTIGEQAAASRPSQYIVLDAHNLPNADLILPRSQSHPCHAFSAVFWNKRIDTAAASAGLRLMSSKSPM